MSANPATLIVFLLLIVLVIGIGFAAARWRQGDLTQLHEWGLGGRRFGTMITWFLLGGDFYTAYTFIAVPTLMFGAGAAGFFAVPYTILMYPLLFMAFPRLWSVSRRHGYVTAADFVRGRFGNRMLALAVAVTGIVATVPYIALQLMGMQVVTAALGIKTDWEVPGVGMIHNMPLLAAFAALSLYTYRSGLRGTALIAVVKDFLIYATVLAAIIIIPAQLGGFAKIFASVDPKTVLLAPGDSKNLGAGFAYASLALGSALALFLYPHSVTGILSSSSRQVIQRNSIFLPAYSFALALIALMGYMAVAAGVKSMPEYASGFAMFGNNFAIPALFLHAFPAWFAGVAFAAIAIGALVPAAIMAIACANLFTRNIFKEFIAPDCSPRQEAEVAKIASLTVKLAALFFVLELRGSYAIELQLLGGIWICQTLPAVLISLYTRFFNPVALLIGWATGMITGTWMAATLAFQGSTYLIHIFGTTVPCYAAVSALVINILVSYGLSLAFNRFSTVRRADETIAEDYV
jgi:SSS family solute:Na+ symporter